MSYDLTATWQNALVNFDNLMVAMWSLFQVRQPTLIRLQRAMPPFTRCAAEWGRRRATNLHACYLTTMLMPNTRLNTHPFVHQVATLESWSDVMYQAADSTQLYHQPLPNAWPTVCLFFVVFVVVGAFFLLNFVIGEWC